MLKIRHTVSRHPRGVAQDHLFGALRAGGVEVSVMRAAHRSFMDAYFLVPPPANVLDQARAHAITTAYLRAFLDTHLLGRPSPLLTAASPAYPEVRLRVMSASGP